MPELPEVETVKRTLLDLVKGKIIDHVTVHWGKIIKNPDDVELFKTLLQGEKVEDIKRRGKFLIFYTTHYALVSHLRMEGKYSVVDHGDEMDKHTHVLFTFTDGSELRYKDVRKFGTMHLFPKGEEMESLPLSQLGPEPWDDMFTPEYLKEKLAKTNRKIKITLLDQQAVVGLGNIYVDEALFRAHIHPERTSSSLTGEEVKLLHKEIIATLEEALEKGGSTIRSYLNSQGEAGTFQETLYAYGRTGEPCLVCGTPMEKTKVGGRGTHYCPNCQKMTR